LSTLIDRGTAVAKKKAEQPKRYGTLARVSDSFAEALKKVSTLENSSMAEFADLHLMPIIEKRYREALAREAKRMGGGS
jgi:hypothetical protein